MPRYILRFKTGGKDFVSDPVEAKSHYQALLMMRSRYPKTVAHMSNFDLADSIGVITRLTGLDKVSGYDKIRPRGRYGKSNPKKAKRNKG